MATMQDAFEAAKQVGDRVNLQRAYNNYASLLIQYGSDLRRARELAREGLELAEKGRGEGWLGWIRNTGAEVSLNLGELDEAEREVRASIHHAAAAGDQPLVGLASGILSWVLLWRGRPDDAKEALARARGILREMPEPQGDVVLERIDGELALALGREADALERLRRGAALADEYSVDLDSRVVLALIRLLVGIGRGDEALEALAILERGRSPLSRASVAIAQGLLASDPERAIEALSRAVQELEALGMRVDLGRTLLDLGRAKRAAGQDPREAFERARELFVACDAQLFLPEAEAELASGA
jgi:tetratricopeptide (TPR) repeat protein